MDNNNTGEIFLSKLAEMDRYLGKRQDSVKRGPKHENFKPHPFMTRNRKNTEM